MLNLRCPVAAAVAAVALLTLAVSEGWPGPAPEESYLVARVIDGDTVELENGERVRYIGIDTPETVHPEKPVQCFGPEASHRNKELVEGRRVRLERDMTDRDKYGRLLRYVYVSGVMVNAALVEGGYAYSYYYAPDTRHYEKLVKVEQEAKGQGRGLWAACTD